MDGKNLHNVYNVVDNQANKQRKRLYKLHVCSVIYFNFTAFPNTQMCTFKRSISIADI